MWISANRVEAPLCALGDDTAPRIEWLAPIEDLREAGDEARISVALDVTDDFSGVQAVWLRVDGVDQPVVREVEPFGFADVVFPTGRYALVAVACDRAGNIGTSAARTIDVGSSEEPGDTGDESSDDGTAPRPNDTDDVDALPPGFGADGSQGGCRVATPVGHGVWWLEMVAAFARRRRESIVPSPSVGVGIHADAPRMRASRSSHARDARAVARR